MNFYLQLNTKEDILKNVGNQTVDRTPFFFILCYSMGSINCCCFLGELSLYM